MGVAASVLEASSAASVHLLVIAAIANEPVQDAAVTSRHHLMVLMVSDITATGSH